MSIMEFDSVSFSHENTAILRQVSVTIAQGEFLSIMGPSGSGKSTFLKLCSHLISPTEGAIRFKGEDVVTLNPTSLRKSIAYCFQTPHLFGDTVEDNLRFPFHIRNEKYDPDKVQVLLNQFEMNTDYMGKRVTTLSGGEKQRLSLIRSLLFPPEILLLDEITSALDVENMKITESIIHTLNKEGMTILWITHSPEQSRKYAHRRMTLERGEISALEVLT